MNPDKPPSANNVALKSTYLRMRDGVRIAVDTWLPAHTGTPTAWPAVVMLTRYWRGYELADASLENQKFFREASHFVEHGFAFVCADARGTGASFGARGMELGSDEISDMGELCTWAAARPWCDGNVVTYGTSYTADTAFLVARHAPKALRMIAAHAMDFDIFSQCMSPGGIPNTWMRKTWGEMVAALDANDFARAAAISATTHPGAQRDENVLGVLPVDVSNRVELESAIAAHAENFRMSVDLTDDDFAFRDPHNATVPGMVGVAADMAGLLDWGGPIFYRAGWMDAGTPDGAIQLFSSLPNSIHVAIGPWSHGMGFIADPYRVARPLPLSEKWDSTIKAARRRFSATDGNGQLGKRLLEYFTYGEDRWKQADAWPIPGTELRSFYFAADCALSADIGSDGQDRYQVEFNASTGRSNRWYTQLSGGRVEYPERADADRLLLTYDTTPLESDIEVTGFPVLHAYLSSTTNDGALFAYLEDVSPDGGVHLITEGMLRFIHCRESSPPANYRVFGPYHSFARADARPFPVGHVAQLSFALISTSVLFRRGHRIRIALAGADRDTFAPLPTGAPPNLTFYRGRSHPSRLQLPVVPRAD